MSTTSKPFTYPALQVLMQYMHPESRFVLSKRCPEIRTADRSVPLALSHLKFGNGVTRVNDITYHLQIIQRAKPGQAIPEHNPIRDFPIQWDIDEYGFNDPSSINAKTPGHLNLRTLNQSLPERDFKDIVEEKDLESLVKKMGYNVDQQNRAKLDAYRRRKQGVPSPYQFYIMLTIISGDWMYVECVEYNKRFHEAVKYLNSQLFEGRKKVVVETLALEDPKYFLQLPINFSCEVKHLKCDSIDLALLHETVRFSSPYDLTVMYNWEYDFVHRTPGYTNARQLTFIVDNELVDYEDLNTLNVYQEVQLMPMHEESICIDFIRDWLDKGRPNGTKFSFGMHNVQAANRCMRKIQSEFGASLLRDRTQLRPHRILFFQVTNGQQQLKIFKRRVMRGLNDYFDCAWCLRVEVEANPVHRPLRYAPY
ncbi:unnamed protein product [Caenorhabditis brenneri]